VTYKPRVESSEPYLSVLLPAYNYAAGIERIVEIFNKSSHKNAELIIHDDSLDESIGFRVRNMENMHGNILKYVRNSPSLGAPSNWNSLINSARGTYFLFLHHDEFPAQEGFFDQVCKTIEQYTDLDILILPLYTNKIGSSYYRKLFPTWIKKLIVAAFPQYLLCHNVIGPPSCVVVKKSISGLFDKNLTYLVDGEWYLRLFERARHISFGADSLSIISVSGEHVSITSTIGESLFCKRRAETQYITKHRDIGFAAIVNSPKGIGEMTFSIAVEFSWYFAVFAMRTVQKLASTVRKIN
jgi:glycosyltransferase involved in cell wall biosynthesis